MKIWPGWRLTVLLERNPARRCPFTQQTADGPMRCMFNAGHPPHGHSCIRDLSGPPSNHPACSPTTGGDLMPRHLITFPGGQGREDFRIDDDLTLSFSGDWAVFSDEHGPNYAIPAGLGVTIERVDEDQTPAHLEPALQKE